LLYTGFLFKATGSKLFYIISEFCFFSKGV
jgi:hypothetical protein